MMEVLASLYIYLSVYDMQGVGPQKYTLQVNQWHSGERYQYI